MMAEQRTLNRMRPDTRIIHARLIVWGGDPDLEPDITLAIRRLYPQEQQVMIAKYKSCLNAREIGMSKNCFAVTLCLARAKIATYIALLADNRKSSLN